MLDRHIELLCRQYGLTRRISRGRGQAKIPYKLIQHPPIRDLMSYFVALHEIGHHEVGLLPDRLTREARAWHWALNNSLMEAPYDVRQRICACLVRYIHKARKKSWPIPKENSFWSLLTWWLPVENSGTDPSNRNQSVGRDDVLPKDPVRKSPG